MIGRRTGRPVPSRRGGQSEDSLYARGKGLRERPLNVRRNVIQDIGSGPAGAATIGRWPQGLARRAGSAVQRYLELHGEPPRICITFRIAVGVKIGTRRIPKGGRLAQVWELLGHRGAGWSPEIADRLIGRRLEMSTYTQVEGRRRRPGQTASRLPTALRRTWGLDIIEARPPEVGRCPRTVGQRHRSTSTSARSAP